MVLLKGKYNERINDRTINHNNDRREKRNGGKENGIPNPPAHSFGFYITQSVNGNSWEIGEKVKDVKRKKCSLMMKVVFMKRLAGHGNVMLCYVMLLGGRNFSRIPFSCWKYTLFLWGWGGLDFWT
ncbi:hypothetical protein ACMFMG_004001 [Clarireedia jacksonii]